LLQGGEGDLQLNAKGERRGEINSLSFKEERTTFGQCSRKGKVLKEEMKKNPMSARRRN